MYEQYSEKTHHCDKLECLEGKSKSVFQVQANCHCTWNLRKNLPGKNQQRADRVYDPGAPRIGEKRWQIQALLHSRAFQSTSLTHWDRKISLVFAVETHSLAEKSRQQTLQAHSPLTVFSHWNVDEIPETSRWHAHCRKESAPQSFQQTADKN